MEEKPKSIWPARREALRRLLVITVVLFPLSWLCFAFCVDSWAVPMSTSEDARHIFEWMVILAAGIAVVFLASLLPVFGRLQRFLNWFFSPRIFRRLAIVTIWVVTAIIFFYVEENWRATRAWNNYRQQLEAQGVQLDFAAFVPKQVPDEQNFGAAPVVKSWFFETDQRSDTNAEKFVKYWQDNYEMVTAGWKPGDPTNQHFMDLPTWGADFEAIRKGDTNSIHKPGEGNPDLPTRAAAAASVLAGLETNAATLAELKEASARPLCRYPVVYNVEEPYTILLPHLNNLRAACLRLELRACAELAAGRGDAALSDMKLILYLGDSLKDEPFLISALIRMAAVKLAIQPAWEGLAEHAWTDAQLQELELLFARYNFVAELKWPMDGERAADSISVGELIRKKGMGVFIEILGPGQPTPFDRRVADIGGVIIPGGWFRREEMTICRGFQLQLEGISGAETKGISPSQVQAGQDAMTRELGRDGIVGTILHHRLLASALLPSLSRIIVRCAETQTAANQAAIACALERFRLANGNFPETLDALAPKFIAQLPKDAIDAQPMKYRRTSDGHFILYSVGWNEKDDGGTPGKTLFDQKDGDWVWEYPGK